MEQIYTIPINEAFEDSIKHPETGCPFCKLYKKLEQNELELILGASMMEPEIRQKTNKTGFCKEHWRKMFDFGNNKLPLALILESHLATVADEMKTSHLMPAVKGSKTAKGLDKIKGTCYICDKLDTNFTAVLNNAAYLWTADASFREKCAKQPCFCVKHYGEFLEVAKGLKRKDFAELYRCISPIAEKHIKSLKEDISAFVKQFDYRYEGDGTPVTKEAISNAVSSLDGEKF